MVYVPSEWVRHSKNKKKVTIILEKLDNDFTLAGEETYNKEMAIKELQEIDEPVIIEKLKAGLFNFGS